MSNGIHTDARALWQKLSMGKKAIVELFKQMSFFGGILIPASVYVSRFPRCAYRPNTSQRKKPITIHCKLS